MKPLLPILALLSGCGLNTPDTTAYNANLYAKALVEPVTTAWLGDSYVALGAWDAWIPGSENLGHGGDDTGAVLARMPPSVPATVYLWCGANDINDGTPRAATLATYGAIIDALRNSGATRVVCLSVLPYAKTFPVVFDVGYDPTMTNGLDDQLQAVAVAHGAEWIDLRPAIVDKDGWVSYSMPAGIHLNAAGYARVLTLLRPAG